MVKKSKTSRYNRKRTKSRVGTDNQLEGLSHHYRDIQWFWQFLKLAVDYEGKTLNVAGRLIWTGGFERKDSKVRLGRSLLKGSGGTTHQLMNKRVISGGKNYPIKITDWKQFDLKELRELDPILTMKKKDIFKNYDNWFKKNGHLFKAKAVRYAEEQKDIINDPDYFTIQIPRHLEKYNIEKQIEKIRKVHKVGRIPSLQSVKFNDKGKGIVGKNLQRMFDVFKLKETTDMTSEQISTALKISSGKVYVSDTNQQAKGIRVVQDNYERVKYLIVNLCKGKFPITAKP
jgi:protein-tyrosine-phosphatase